MAEALESLEDGPSQSSPAVTFKESVDRKALRDHHTGKVETLAYVGRKLVLTNEDEEILVRHLKDMSSIGFGYDESCAWKCESQ